MDLSAIEEHDKRRAAFHEAGHAVTALECGCLFVRAQIFKSPTDAVLDEKLWVGQCSYSRASDEAQPIIGISGWVAEMILSNDWQIDCWLDLDPNDLSETDQPAFENSENWGKTVADAHTILMKRWHDVEKIAAMLISVETLTDFQISQLVSSK